MKRLLSLALSLVLVLSACSSGPRKISAPITSTGYHSYTADDLAAEFTGKGFSNVSTTQETTDDPDKDGRIIKVSVDGSYTFTDVTQYLPDVPVVITHYVYVAPTPTPTPEPEEVDVEYIRDLAKLVDYDVLTYTAAGESAYKSFLSLMADSSTPRLDLYDAAGTMKGEVEDRFMDVHGLELEEVPEFTTYQDAAKKYLYTMTMVADAVRAYLDDDSTSNLSKVKSATVSVDAYFDNIAPARTAFLLAAGYAEDEIATLHAQ